MAIPGQTVSVVIPNYNQERTLPACLAAVAAQTVKPVDVVVADDASTDRSREVAERSGCVLVELPVNRGAAAARNAGVAASSGDIIFFIDSDIVLAPDAIEHAVAILADDPRCALVQGVYDKVPLYGRGAVETYKTLHEYYWRSRSAGVVGMTLFALAAMPRAVFDEVGGFDESVREIEDVVFGTRLPAGYRVRLTDRVVGRHDDVKRLLPMLRSQVRRARMLTAKVGGGGRARVRAFAPAGLVAALAALLAMPLAVRTPAALLAIPLALVVLAVAERGLFRFVRHEHGTPFAVRFAVLHLLVYAATVLGAGLGLPRFALRAAGRTGRRPRRAVPAGSGATR